MIDISYKNLEEAHKHTIRNREELEKSEFVFCISCRSFVQPSDVTEFVDGGQTGLCPFCDVDALIGDACGIRLTDKLLSDLHYKYFSNNPTIKLTIDRQKDRPNDKCTVDIEAAYTIISCEYDKDWLEPKEAEEAIKNAMFKYFEKGDTWDWCPFEIKEEVDFELTTAWDGKTETFTLREDSEIEFH